VRHRRVPLRSKRRILSLKQRRAQIFGVLHLPIAPAGFAAEQSMRLQYRDAIGSQVSGFVAELCNMVDDRFAIQKLIVVRLKW
jgi:hypothetical protein